MLATAAVVAPVALLLASCELMGEEIAFRCGDATVTQGLDSRTPGWVQTGGTAHLDVKGTWFDGLELPGTVTKVALSVPVPTNIAEITKVTFTGGTFSGTSTVEGRTIKIDLTATGGAPDLPTLGIDGTVKAGAADQVQWFLYDHVEITAGAPAGGDDDHSGGGDHAHGMAAMAAPTDRGTVCTIKDEGYIVNFSRIGDDPAAPGPTMPEPPTTPVPPTTVIPTTVMPPTTPTVLPPTTVTTRPTPATTTTMPPAPPSTDSHGHTGDDHARLEAPPSTDSHGHTGDDHARLEGAAPHDH
jgi:hypothetical protein